MERGDSKPVLQELSVQWGRHKSCYQGISSPWRSWCFQKRGVGGNKHSVPTVCWVLCTGHYFSPLFTLLSFLLQSPIFQVRTVMLRKFKKLVLGSPVSPVAKLGLESRSPYANMEDHVTLAQVHHFHEVFSCPGCRTNHLCLWVPIVPQRNAPWHLYTF